MVAAASPGAAADFAAGDAVVEILLVEPAANLHPDYPSFTFKPSVFVANTIL